ncbi:MAG: phenylalanine--tRNA ligase subunit beta, partial [Syntrophomonadaceae bacterium]|nr:phenylalanine--tRNA ligase subunit beta [Syntrophomonadaceae bacterium]
LVACGLSEVVTFSMVSPRVFDRIGLPAVDPLRQTISLANPLNEEQSCLRTTLIPNLLEVASRNVNRRVTELAIFELGNVFLPQNEANLAVRNEGLPDERLYVAGLTMGDFPRSWQGPAGTQDFYFLKGVVEALLEGLGVKDHHFLPANLGPTFHPGRSAEIKQDGEVLGLLAELHPDILEEYGLPQRACVFQLDLERVLALRLPGKRYTPITRYPAVQRDLAVIIPDDLPAATVLARIQEAGQPLLKQVTLFDLYRGEPIPPGYRSMAYSLVYQTGDRTLTDEEVNKQHQQVRDFLVTELGIQLR